MARVQSPPTNHQMTIPDGFITRRWGQWIQAFFKKLGGTAGVGTYRLTVRIDDISVATTTYLAVPHNSSLRKVYCAINGTITGVNESIEVLNNSSASIGTILIPVTSAAGYIATVSPTTNNLFSDGDKVSLVSAGTSSGALSANFILVFEYT